jgi:hypothetical protein
MKGLKELEPANMSHLFASSIHPFIRPFIHTYIHTCIPLFVGGYFIRKLSETGQNPGGRDFVGLVEMGKDL